MADQATTKPDRNLGVRKALEAYQETRHERSSRVVATSREAGFLWVLSLATGMCQLLT